MEEYPKPATKQSIENIFRQMNCSFYKIIEKDKTFTNCFFTHIKYKKEKIPVIIINNFGEYNHKIEISINNKNEIIELSDIKYINKNYNLTIIKIKENKKDNIQFLEIDENIYDKESEIYYIKDSIYVIHYIQNDILVSFGIINNISKNKITYISSKLSYSKGSPILNLSNNKLIGLCMNNSNFYSKGIYFYEIIQEFIQEYKAWQFSKNKTNEIDIIVKINKDEINKKIYFLDNDESQIPYHNNLKELNDLNTELYVNNKKCKYEKYIISGKEGEYNIKLKFNMNLTDCSYMFLNCTNILNINFISFNTKNVVSMRSMFNGCNLKEINLLSFDTRNVHNMRCMFAYCKYLRKLDLSSFDTNKVTDMSCMFKECSSLNSLPDISKWNTDYVTDIREIFAECKLLISIPDISKWNTEKVTDMCGMFKECSSLNSLPDISKWNTDNITDMKEIFDGCKLLKSIPDISKWNTEKVTDMSFMFYNCSQLGFIS